MGQVMENMEVLHIEYPPAPSSLLTGRHFAVAIGDFDGVHLGHQDVIRKAKQIAENQSLITAVMTFNPHPREVLGNARYSRYLAPLNKKLDLFKEMGVEYTFVVQFDESFSRLSARQFVDEMLRPLHVSAVVVGFDFTFGHKAQGTVDTLKQLCAGLIDVHVVEPYVVDGEKVSSTRIREHLHRGNLAKVKQYTGRDYFVTGTVVQGDGRGRTIGFPTANIRLDEPFVLPMNGVYAVRCLFKDRREFGVMNIGVRPTFYDDLTEPTLEVHLLDFAGDLYGENVRIEFLEFIRPERKFPDKEALVSQIEKDIEEARKIRC